MNKIHENLAEEIASGRINPLSGFIKNHMNLPESFVESCKLSHEHFLLNGVEAFYLDMFGYILTVLAIVLMFMNKKIGFIVYLFSQLMGVTGIFWNYGLTTFSVASAAGFTLISLVFILLYRNWFWHKHQIKSSH